MAESRLEWAEPSALVNQYATFRRVLPGGVTIGYLYLVVGRKSARHHLGAELIVRYRYSMLTVDPISDAQHAYSRALERELRQAERVQRLKKSDPARMIEYQIWRAIRQETALLRSALRRTRLGEEHG